MPARIRARRVRTVTVLCEPGRYLLPVAANPARALWVADFTGDQHAYGLNRERAGLGAGPYSAFNALAPGFSMTMTATNAGGVSGYGMVFDITGAVSDVKAYAGRGRSRRRLLVRRLRVR